MSASASAAADLLLVDLEGVAVLHLELQSIVSVYLSRSRMPVETLRLTVSGLSVGLTLVPSNRKRTLAKLFPWRSQKASMSFLS